jgi:hypothetical protein
LVQVLKSHNTLQYPSHIWSWVVVGLAALLSIELEAAEVVAVLYLV